MTTTDSDRSAALPAWLFPAAVAALLLGASHLGLVLSFARGEVESLVPHLDGSVSVSKACRKEPAVHLFRALVLPSAPLLALVWWLAADWLRARALAGPRLRRALLVLGLAGALFLVLYATYLGTDGATYRLMRRYGVYVFFAGTSLAQLLLTVALSRARGRLAALTPGLLRVFRASIAFQLAAGPLNIVAGRIVDRERVADALEWWFALAMGIVLVALAALWRREGWRVGPLAAPGSSG